MISSSLWWMDFCVLFLSQAKDKEQIYLILIFFRANLPFIPSDNWLDFFEEKKMFENQLIWNSCAGLIDGQWVNSGALCGEWQFIVCDSRVDFPFRIFEKRELTELRIPMVHIRPYILWIDFELNPFWTEFRGYKCELIFCRKKE